MKFLSHESSSPSRYRNLRVALYALVIAMYGAWLTHPGTTPSAAAQDGVLDESAAGTAVPASGTTSPSSAATKSKVPTTLWDMFLASGFVGFIIVGLSMVAVGFIVEHAMTLRREVIMPNHVVEELESLLQQGQLEEAVGFCQQPQNYSLFANVVLAGLERYRNSEFGFAEYKAAVEESGEEQTAGLYRKTEVLSVIGTITPMLGLLGTVQGMILGFNTIASSGGNARPDDLAASISMALVTTFEGLTVAIPTMVAFSIFRNRIDTLVAEAGKRVEQVLAPLGRRRT